MLKIINESKTFEKLSPEVKAKVEEIKKKRTTVHKLWVSKLISKRDYIRNYKYEPAYYPMAEEDGKIKVAFVVVKELYDTAQISQRSLTPLDDNDIMFLKNRYNL